MQEQQKKFLYDYLNAFAPTGFEVEGQKVWMEYLKPFADEFITDAYGSAVAVFNPGKEYSVVLEAHADEISWFVNYISAEGYIYVTRNGGSDPIIAPAKRARIYTDEGIVKAVFGWPAIHTRRGQEKEEFPKLDNIFLDVGATSDKQVKNKGIRPGNVVVFEDGFDELNEDWFYGRALDNRMGGYMIAEAARRLKKADEIPDFTLYVVNSVQEEVGLRGAQMIAERLKPDAAIITDVTHDTQTPMIEKAREGDIWAGKGAVVTTGPAVHNNLLKELIRTAKEKEIPLQHAAASRSTGTDTDAFAYSNTGVPSALISLPLRYMHTTVEMVHKEDVEGCIRLMRNFIAGLKPGHNFSYYAD